MTSKLKEDPWKDISTPRDPAYTEPDPDDLIELNDAVVQAVRAVAERISTRHQAHRAAGEEPPAQVVLAGDYQLAVLAVLHQVSRDVEKMASDAASMAGHQGISYTKLGAAWGGITRQSARTKWPEAVSPRSSGKPQAPTPFEYAGGHATVYQDAETGDWWYLAVGADGAYEESPRDHESQAVATAVAATFLTSHAVTSGETSR
ncbi:hypothetical protein ACF06P_08910 [Streptomyces sp. NPDC015684]|uniref:hypothetical protein n=1 Tax=Streptomyces sp. NPDC015684 TaxID=3364963 RepID=UPI0036FFAB2B